MAAEQRELPEVGLSPHNEIDVRSRGKCVATNVTPLKNKV